MQEVELDDADDLNPLFGMAPQLGFGGGASSGTTPATKPKPKPKPNKPGTQDRLRHVLSPRLNCLGGCMLGQGMACAGHA